MTPSVASVVAFSRLTASQGSRSCPEELRQWRPPTSSRGERFVGFHLAEVLLDRGDGVVALENLSTRRIEDVQKPRSYTTFDSSLAPCSTSCASTSMCACDVVVHLTAGVGVTLVVERPLSALTTNISGLRDGAVRRAPIPQEDRC